MIASSDLIPDLTLETHVNLAGFTICRCRLNRRPGVYPTLPFSASRWANTQAGIGAC